MNRVRGIHRQQPRLPAWLCRPAASPARGPGSQHRGTVLARLTLRHRVGCETGSGAARRGRARPLLLPAQAGCLRRGVSDCQSGQQCERWMPPCRHRLLSSRSSRFCCLFTSARLGEGRRQMPAACQGPAVNGRKGMSGQAAAGLGRGVKHPFMNC